MITLTPDYFRTVLESKFPRNASRWSEATDEVRDLCRWARQHLGLGEHLALDFNTLHTPGDWNRRGIDQTIAFYERMTPEQRKAFCNDYAEILSWLVSCRNGTETI